MSKVGYDVNQTTVLSSGLSSLVHAVFKNHVPSVRLLLAVPGIDVNRPDSTHGMTPLHAAVHRGHETCTRVLLTAPGIDVNRPDSTQGQTPLYCAADMGHDACIRLLLAAPGIDVNRPDSTDGETPMYVASRLGREACTRLLLAAPGIDVNCVTNQGESILTGACGHVMESLRQLGSEDATRGLVQLLASRQVTDRVLEQTSSFLRQFWLSNTQVIEMEASGQCLDPAQESVRLLLPVLRAQSLGERRWCGHCWKLTPDRNLPMCTRCRQYGYCCDEEGESNVVCQKKHWGKGGHREECAVLATAITITTTATAAAVAVVEDIARAGGGG